MDQHPPRSSLSRPPRAGFPTCRFTGLSSPGSASFAVPPPHLKFHQPVKFGEICPPRNSSVRPPALGQEQAPSPANPRWPNHLPRRSAPPGALAPLRNRRAGKFKFHQTGWGRAWNPCFQASKGSSLPVMVKFALVARCGTGASALFSDN